MNLEERHVNALSDVLKTGIDGWTDIVDLQPMFFKMTLELMIEFLYEHSSSQMSRKPDASSTQEFEHHFDAGKAWVNLRMALGRWHWLVHSPAFSLHCKKVHQYVDYFVKAKLQQRSEVTETKLALTKFATREKFVLLDELAKQTRNSLEIRGETLDVLDAERDITASLLTWIFYFLSRSPRTFGKLRETILEIFETEASSIDFLKLRSCQYLQHCINETLRMTVVVPILKRESLEDTILLRGDDSDGTKPVFISKGQRVLIFTYALTQRSDIWGNHPEDFIPQRWKHRKVGLEFIPFDDGSRKCIGRKSALSPFQNHIDTDTRFLEQFALTEVSVCLSQISSRSMLSLTE